MRTLIITNSYDVTTDLLIKHIGTDSVFRLNFDLLSEYSIYLNKDSFVLSSPEKKIFENEISKVYWRKPFNINSGIDGYEVNERKYLVRQIFNILDVQGKSVLVNPYKEHSIGKLLQLRIAKSFFKVPEWEMILNHKSSFIECITKSLSSSIINDDMVIFTTKVNTHKIDLTEAWHLQNYIEKDRDLTVVFIAGEMLAFELVNNLELVDWRKNQISDPPKWVPHKLPVLISKQILNFMMKLELNFGRLDFVMEGNEYFFLEVNINGQWAFLDPDDKFGLLSIMSKHIRPD